MPVSVCEDSMKRATLFSVNFLIIASLFFIACGRKGAPKPPENFAPTQVQFFQARGTVDGILLTWAKPEKKADGEELDDLERFAVMRAVYEKDRAAEFDELTEIAYIAPEKPEKDEAAATRSEKEEEEIEEFSFLDEKVSPGQKYVYYVVAFNEDNVGGRPSQSFRVTFIGEASQVELYTGSD